MSLGEGPAAVRGLLARVGQLQLDPIDRIGTNVDLVVHARIDGLCRGEVHAALRGVSFEHFAKERCLLDARFFAHYRGRAVETPWWRNTERMRKLDEALLADVLTEVAERGPSHAGGFTDRGKAEAMDWSGWKGTGSRTALALEVLWTRCLVVVSGRDARGRRLYDTPARALGEHADAVAEGDFGEEMLVARVCAAGLLALATGPTWSMLRETRADGTIERLVEAGRLVRVAVGRRVYLCLPETGLVEDDGRVRILGPLDSVLWDRALVREAFGFDYVWEVYKPEALRTWGYYVCPLLQDGRFVGRLEARRDAGVLRVERLWGGADPVRLGAALERLAVFNGCDAVVVADEAARGDLPLQA